MNLTLRNKIQSCDFEKLFLKLGYSYFTAGDYNLNIIGIRSDNDNKVTDLFDDYPVNTVQQNAQTAAASQAAAQNVES